MKTIVYIILILAVGLPYHLNAQEYDLEPDQQPPALISVSGYGIANVQPDEIQVSISIQLQDDSVDDLNDLMNNRSSAVIEILHDANVTDEDIESSNVSIWPYYATSSSYGSPAPASYQGKKAMTFTLKNSSDYDSIITELYEAGINSVDSVIFQLSNDLLQAKKMEARKNAAANLKDSLNTFIEGLGLQIGQAYTVSEYTYGGDPQPYYGYQNTRYAVVQAGEVAIVVEGEGGGSGTSSGSSIAPDDFLITSTINAQYYIV